VRVLGAIIQIAVLPVLNAGQHLPLRGTIAFQAIGDDDPWDVVAALEELAEELLGRPLVTPTLHQDVEHMAVLIHRPPQIVTRTTDREKHLVQVPLVAGPGAPTSELIDIRLSEFSAPLPDRLVGDDDATGEQELFHITVAETEPEIQPDAVADNLGREAVVLVAVGEGWCVHPPSISHSTTAQQVDNACSRPHRKTSPSPRRSAVHEAREELTRGEVRTLEAVRRELGR
jgi:hypothetical protein